MYRELDRLGMEFNASTYSEMVQFYICGSDKNFNSAAEMISRLLSPIVLDRVEIDAERDRVKAEIREVDDKSTLAFISGESVWRNTPLAGAITGTLGSVSRISARKLEDYRRRVFNSNNIFFYVTGNVEDGALDYLCELVGRYRVDGEEMHDNVAKVPDEFCKRRKNIGHKNADFTKIRYSFDVDMSKVSCAELDLLYDTVLGGYSSDFFIELSEKRGLFYDLGGSVERYRNVGVFSFSYELKESKLTEAVRMTSQLLRSYTERTVEPERSMRACYVDNADMLLDDPRELCFTFAYDNHILDLGYSGIEDRKRAYASITPERIREVAKEVFRPENLTVTLKANKKKINFSELENIIFGE